MIHNFQKYFSFSQFLPGGLWAGGTQFPELVSNEPPDWSEESPGSSEGPKPWPGRARPGYLLVVSSQPVVTQTLSDSEQAHTETSTPVRTICEENIVW